jgi:hypothetical protein
VSRHLPAPEPALAGSCRDDDRRVGAIDVVGNLFERDGNCSRIGERTARGSSPPCEGPRLSGFVLADADLSMSGVSHLVDDPAAAGSLRGLRDQYLSDRDAQPGLYVNWDGLATTDPSATAFVYMRDAIPYENATGLLAF